jgi:hypothetical protein
LTLLLCDREVVDLWLKAGRKARRSMCATGPSTYAGAGSDGGRASSAAGSTAQRNESGERRDADKRQERQHHALGAGGYEDCACQQRPEDCADAADADDAAKVSPTHPRCVKVRGQRVERGGALE